jgi:hypothetical protein
MITDDDLLKVYINNHLQCTTNDAIRFARAVLALAEQRSAELIPAKKLWLWKNFVNGRPEYWAFDNPFPVRMDCGDPQTLGEPCGYAILKESRNGRPDVPEAEVLRRIALSAQKQAAALAEQLEMERIRRDQLIRHAENLQAHNAELQARIAELEAPKPAQVAAPEGLDIPKLITAARMVTQYRYCMSYNEAYFSEAPGLFKTRIAELDRALPALYPAAAIKAAPKQEGGEQ